MLLFWRCLKLFHQLIFFSFQFVSFFYFLSEKVSYKVKCHIFLIIVYHGIILFEDHDFSSETYHVYSISLSHHRLLILGSHALFPSPYINIGWSLEECNLWKRRYSFTAKFCDQIFFFYNILLSNLDVYSLAGNLDVYSIAADPKI